MSWIQKLYETYEACAGNPNIPDSGNLPPIGYSTQCAHIEVVIDGDGEFRRASFIEKKDQKILIPVTGKSVGRTTGVAPHPLCDSIQYCAEDYPDFGGSYSSYFDPYYTQLKDWAESESSHPKVKAVHAYVSKKTLVKDIIESKLLDVDSDGHLTSQKKGIKYEDPHPVFKWLSFDTKDTKDQAKIFIRWVVECPEELVTCTWQDKSLFNSWFKYTESKDTGNTYQGFCHVTGEYTKLATTHPAKIRHGGDKAKIISSNDKTEYTFRGHFNTADEAAGVSSEVTQKAHNALRWLIGRKGSLRSGDMAIISWHLGGADIPDPYADSWDFLADQELTSDEAPAISDIGQAFAIRLRKKMTGYRASLAGADGVVVMGLDSAVPGRMAIIYYQELTGSEFLDKVERWHSDFAWPQNYGKDKHFVGAPSPRDIIKAAYRDGLKGKSGETLAKNTLARINPCIIEGAQFPQDLVTLVVRRVSNRAGFKVNEMGDWEKCLGIACSLVKGVNQKEGYTMALDESRTTRDYLFGRLLAIADGIESMALYLAKEKRDTNAARFMQRFSDRPLSTWRSLEASLVPYAARIHAKVPGLLVGYRELMDEVFSAFTADDFTSDRCLSGEYLLGYHSQRKWLREHKIEKGQWVLRDTQED